MQDFFFSSIYISLTLLLVSMEIIFYPLCWKLSPHPTTATLDSLTTFPSTYHWVISSGFSLHDELIVLDLFNLALDNIPENNRFPILTEFMHHKTKVNMIQCFSVQPCNA